MIDGRFNITSYNQTSCLCFNLSYIALFAIGIFGLYCALHGIDPTLRSTLLIGSLCFGPLFLSISILIFSVKERLQTQKQDSHPPETHKPNFQPTELALATDRAPLLLEELPTEIQEHILSFLDTPSLLEWTLVSHHFHTLLNNEQIWKTQTRSMAVLEGILPKHIPCFKTFCLESHCLKGFGRQLIRSSPTEFNLKRKENIPPFFLLCTGDFLILEEYKLFSLVHLQSKKYLSSIPKRGITRYPMAVDANTVVYLNEQGLFFRHVFTKQEIQVPGLPDFNLTTAPPLYIKMENNILLSDSNRNASQKYYNHLINFSGTLHNTIEGHYICHHGDVGVFLKEGFFELWDVNQDKPHKQFLKASDWGNVLFGTLTNDYFAVIFKNKNIMVWDLHNDNDSIQLRTNLSFEAWGNRAQLKIHGDFLQVISGPNLQHDDSHEFFCISAQKSLQEISDIKTAFSEWIQPNLLLYTTRSMKKLYLMDIFTKKVIKYWPINGKPIGDRIEAPNYAYHKQTFMCIQANGKIQILNFSKYV